MGSVGYLSMLWNWDVELPLHGVLWFCSQRERKTDFNSQPFAEDTCISMEEQNLYASFLWIQKRKGELKCMSVTGPEDSQTLCRRANRQMTDWRVHACKKIARELYCPFCLCNSAGRLIALHLEQRKSKGIDNIVGVISLVFRCRLATSA